VRRTYETDGGKLEHVADLDDWVHDKRVHWRANAAKSRRRQRRYQEKLTRHLLREAGHSSRADDMRTAGNPSNPHDVGANVAKSAAGG